MALPITNNQGSIIDSINLFYHLGLSEGVESGSIIVPYLNPYNPFNVPTKVQVCCPAEGLFSAVLKYLNIKNPLPTGLTTTVTLAKVTPTGTFGSMTFVNGFLILKVEPT